MFIKSFSDRMESVVASRISILILSLKDDIPRRSVFVGLDKLNLDVWGSFCSNCS